MKATKLIAKPDYKVMNKTKNIMIADDDAGIVDFLTIMLEFEGYNVQSTLNGASLFDLEKKSALPDLLLLDIWMSGVDGRDICRFLKQQESTRGIPIMMLSASRDIEESALQACADDILAKPFEMNELLKKIEKHLNKQHH